MPVVNVGVIGCGIVTQWMYLPYLAALPEYRVTAVCDISPAVASSVAARFSVERSYTDYTALLDQADVNAVVITVPLHSDAAIAAAQAGKHVLVETPIALNITEAEAMVDAAEGAGTILMVAYMKRFDPGYLFGQRLMRAMEDVRLIRVHDVCGPNAAVLADVTRTVRDPQTEARIAPARQAEIRQRLERAIGVGHPEAVYRAYDRLGGVVSHDLSLLRGVFGSPRRVTHAQIWHDGRYILAMLDYNAEQRCIVEIGLTNTKDCDEEFTAFGERSTVRVRFPSPFVKDAATVVEVTAQEENALEQRAVTAAYDAAINGTFKQFHTCVTEGQEPTTSGRDALEDLRLQIQIVKTALT